MSIDIMKTLKAGKAFAGLKDEELRSILPKFEKIFLYKGEKAFEQGDDSDGVVLLLTGKLITFLRKDKYLEKMVTTIHPGDTIGEMGAFSREPRTTTARATENSIILKLSSENFRQLCDQYPQIIINAMTTLAKRSHSIIDALAQPQIRKKHLAVMPADESPIHDFFYQKMLEHLPKLNGVAILSDYDHEFSQNYNSVAAIAALVRELNTQEKTILYFLGAHETPLSLVCFEQVDIIYVVADADKKPQLTSFVRSKMREATTRVKPELILLYQNKQHLPKRSSKWLKLADFRFWHHIRLYQTPDLERMGRFFMGKAVGLVLGGGGIRSWAHMGVIRALMESGVPIDFVAGTSGGAIVGAYFALHETYRDPKQVLRALSKATSNTLSFRALTWPAISLTDSKQYTQKLQQVFGKIRIENLWRPFFCVSCKLTTNTAAAHRRGLLWEKVRASSSIPGVFPPVVLKGKIYLDGGIANNLPVDLMQKISDNVSTIIAVELIHNVPEEKNYHFPPILPFWKVILSKLNLGFRDYKFPHFIDTFLRSLLVGSTLKQNENSLAADILIQPDLSKFHLLSITRQQEKELMLIGYRSALKALQKTNWSKKPK